MYKTNNPIKLIYLVSCLSVFFFFCFSTSTAFATTDMTVRADLLKKLNAINTMTGSFLQIPAGRSAALRKDVQGTFVLKKPGAFRWDIDKPSIQKWVSNGRTLWIEDVDLKQVTVKRVANQAGSSPLQLLSGDAARVLDHYTLREIAPNNVIGQAGIPNQVCYDFSSLGHSDFQHVQLCFQQNTLTWMKMTDNVNHTSIINFAHVQLNPAINSTVFQFRKPIGYDVINEG